MKYLMKWTKEGNLRFISHLDIVRLFQRAMKRQNIPLQYSGGYSPHAKLSIAQPLSLGYTSQGEYAEFETSEPMEAPEILRKMQCTMPEGIRLCSCTLLTDTKKAVGGLVVLADYTMRVRLRDAAEEERLASAVTRFMHESEIIIMKTQKKSGKEVPLNIREKVKSLTLEGTYVSESVAEGEPDRWGILRTTVDTGSQSHLNPEIILVKLAEFMDILREDWETYVQRDEMYAESVTASVIPLYLLS